MTADSRSAGGMTAQSLAEDLVAEMQRLPQLSLHPHTDTIINLAFAKLRLAEQAAAERARAEERARIVAAIDALWDRAIDGEGILFKDIMAVIEGVPNDDAAIRERAAKGEG